MDKYNLKLWNLTWKVIRILVAGDWIKNLDFKKLVYSCNLGTGDLNFRKNRGKIAC